MATKCKFIFLGSALSSALFLDIICQKRVYPSLTITNPDKPQGRGYKLKPNPVKEIAQKFQIDFYTTSKIKEDKKLIDRIIKIKPLFFLVYAFSQIIPENFLRMFPYGGFNIHPSLLPKYRGPAPIPYVIIAGEKQTGVTIHKLTSKIDAGPILVQKSSNISSKDTSLSLSQKLTKLAASLFIEILPKLRQNKITLLPQDEKQATYTKKITKIKAHIKWEESALLIERKIRAFIPWPVAYTFWQNKRLQILQAQVLNPDISCADSSQIGKVFKTSSGKLAVTCGKGSLVLEKVKLEGKSQTKGEDFLRGYPDILKAQLK